MKRQTLRDYQEEAIRHLVENDPAMFIVSPGAGKTRVIQGTVAHSKRARVMVITPKEDVEEALVEPMEAEGAYAFRLTSQDWIRGRDLDSVQASFSHYLSHVQRGGPRAFVTTHAGFLHIESLPQNMSDWHIIVDEVHHSAAYWTELGQRLSLLRARGAQIAAVTATSVRPDQRPLLDTAFHVYAVPYSFLIVNHGFPSRIDVRLTALDDAAETKNGAPANVSDRAIDAIIEIVRAGEAPAVVQIPSGNTAGGAEALADRIVSRFHAAGYEKDRVVNAVGDANKERFQQVLLDERDRTAFAERTVDVIVACGRMGEASDWPLCGHVITLGVTSSLLGLVQRLGRATRPKQHIADYPMPDVARLTLVVGDLSGLEETAERRLTHQLFHIATELEVSPLAAEFGRYWQQAVQGLRLPPALRPNFIAGLGYDEQRRLGEARRTLARIIQVRGYTTFAEVAEAVRNDPTLEGQDRHGLIRSLVLDHMNEHPTLARAFFDSVPRILTRSLERITMQQPPPPPPKIKAVFEDLLWEAWSACIDDLQPELTHVVVSPTSGLHPSWRAVLTADRLGAIVRTAQQARNATGLPNRKSLFTILRAYRKQWGTYPSIYRGQQDITDLMLHRYALAHLDGDARRLTGVDLDTLGALMAAGYLDEYPYTRAALQAAERALRVRSVDLTRMAALDISKAITLNHLPVPTPKGNRSAYGIVAATRAMEYGEPDQVALDPIAAAAPAT